MTVEELDLAIRACEQHIREAKKSAEEGNH